MRLSLLPTGPPPVFQHWWVRSSTPCYGRFNLPMGRSPGFASIAHDNVALFRLGFPVAPPLKGLTGPHTITRRIIMQKARGQAKARGLALPPLVSTGFQVQCPPLSGFFPPFGRPTGFAIGRHRVLSLTGWSPRIRAGFHVADLTRVPARVVRIASSTGLSPAMAPHSRGLRLQHTNPMTLAPLPQEVILSV